MTPMSGALDWLAVGDVAEERNADGVAILGGGAARLTGHAAALGVRTALVAKLGDDEPGHHVRNALERLKVDLQWMRTAPGMRTTVWHQPNGSAGDRRVDRGADLALRLDELPPLSLTAALTVVCGYSLSVEPARSAALGALSTARIRRGQSALLLEADLLWWTNARTTRRVLEPALRAADSVALRATDALALFGPVGDREAVRLLAEMGPRLVYLTQADGSVLLRDGSRVYACPAAEVSVDRYAGPAAFWVGLAQKVAPRKAALESQRFAQSVPKPTPLSKVRRS